MANRIYRTASFTLDPASRLLSRDDGHDVTVWGWAPPRRRPASMRNWLMHRIGASAAVRAISSIRPMEGSASPSP